MYDSLLVKSMDDENKKTVKEIVEMFPEYDCFELIRGSGVRSLFRKGKEFSLFENTKVLSYSYGISRERKQPRNMITMYI